MSRAPITSLRKRSITFGQTTILAMPHQHHTGAAHTLLVIGMADTFAGDDALLGKHRPQKFHRMALQRQPDGLIIGDHLLRQRHPPAGSARAWEAPCRERNLPAR